MDEESFMYDHYSQVNLDYWKWDHFTPEELAQKGGGKSMGEGKLLVVPSFLDKLEMLRVLCGFPFVINSGYRSPVYNDHISSTGLNGPHTTGRAVDIACHGERALVILENARKCSFTGIGIGQTNPAHHRRFIHLDDLEGSEKQPRPWLWGY